MFTVTEARFDARSSCMAPTACASSGAYVLAARHDVSAGLDQPEQPLWARVCACWNVVRRHGELGPNVEPVDVDRLRTR